MNNNVFNPDLAQKATGAKPLRSFMLDSSVLVKKEEYAIVREDVKQNGVRFFFPEGFNDLDLIEECRALQNPDDFDLMFDITMQMLVGKPVVIYVRNRANEAVEWLKFQVTDRYQNLRSYEKIDSYPMVILWLTEFIAGHLLKKFPMLGSENSGSSKASKKQEKGPRKDKPKVETPFRADSP